MLGRSYLKKVAELLRKITDTNLALPHVCICAPTNMKIHGHNTYERKEQKGGGADLEFGSSKNLNLTVRT